MELKRGSNVMRRECLKIVDMHMKCFKFFRHSIGKVENKVRKRTDDQKD